MRRSMWMLLAALIAVPAFAGPTLSKNDKAAVPESITSQTAVVERDIAGARAKAAEYQREADTLRTSLKTQKLSIDTLEAQWKADKERWKVAKKAKDRASMETIQGELDRTDAQITDAETRLALTTYEADLRQAQADFLSAAAEMAAADVQYVWATSLFDADPATMDPLKFAVARQKAETAYQDARAGLAEAEAAYVAKGGPSQDFGRRDLTGMLSDGGRYTTPPVSVTPESWTNKPAPAAPAPVAPTSSAPPAWTQSPAPEPAPAPAPAPAP